MRDEPDLGRGGVRTVCPRPYRGPRARQRFGPRPDSVEPASDVIVNCFLSSTKEASWGFYEFFRLLLKVPLFTESNTSSESLCMCFISSHD